MSDPTPGPPVFTPTPTIPATVVSPVPYMFAIVATITVYLGAAIAFVLVKNETLAGICLAALPVTITAILGMKNSAESKALSKDATTQSQATHVLFNSRMSELLNLTRTSAHAEGALEGRDTIKAEIKERDAAEIALEGARAIGAQQAALQSQMQPAKAPIPVKIVTTASVPVREVGSVPGNTIDKLTDL